jgi:antitoxin (DNA-binding transcriptional repressor) of toxin-antitoxin stability system
MESVTFSKFVNSPRLRQAVKSGKSFLVTEYGKPYFRVLPPESAATHEGVGRHLFKGKAVSPERIPGAEWGGKE